jgi:hypothetical protein
VKAGNQMKYPERAMKLSKHAAMVSLVRLIQRYDERLPEIYESTQTIWKEARKISAKLRAKKVGERAKDILLY